MTTRDKGERMTMQQSEERFRLLFNCAADALFLHDLEGRVVEVNQAACDSLGYTREELLQLPLSVFVKDAKQDRPCQTWERVIKGEKHTLQGVHRRRDGTTFPVEVHLAPFANAGRPHILASARDITERLRAEEALRTSESFLHSIVDQSPYPMWISDNRGTLIKLNQACQDLLHLTAAEVVGKYNIFQDNIVEEQGLLPLVHRVFQQGETVRFEIAYDTARLTTLPLKTSTMVILDVTVSPIINDRGRVTNAVFQHVDITYRKRAQAALAESEKRFSTFMDHLPAAVFIKDQAGHLLFANRYLQDLFGWEDCLGKTTEELLPPEFAARMMEDDRKTLREGPLVVRERIIDVHDQEHFFDTCKFPVTVEGAPGLLGGIALEVTERKRAEEALQQEKLFTEAILDSLPGTFFLFDSQGKHLRTNKSGQLLSGYSNEELSGMHALDFIAGEDKPAVQQAIAEVFEKGETSVEARQLTKDGRKIPFFYTAKKFIIDGEPCLLGTGVDISERKQAEEALRESEERYRSLFQNHHAVMLLVDPENGSIMDANPAACSYYGFSREELLSKKSTDLNTLPREQVFQAMHSAKAEGRRRFEFQHRLANGEIRDVEVFTGPIRVNGRELLSSIIHDVTARKRAEKALRDSEKKYRSLYQEFQGILDAIPDSLSLLSPELKVVWANEVAAEDMDLHLADFIGQFCYQTRHGRSEPCEACAVQKCFASGKPVSGESTTPDGRIWEVRALPLLDDQGEVKGVIEVARGITARKRMEEALRESEARFRQVVESSPLPIGIGNDSGVIEYVNPKFVETFGYTLEDVPRMEDWFRLAYPDPAYRQELLARWRQSLENLACQNGATEAAEMMITCKDGSHRFIEGVATLMGNKSLVVMNDLTERKRAEEALRESEARFRLVVESSPLPIGIAVDEETIEYVNPKFVETFGYSLEDISRLEDWYRLAYPDPRYRQKAVKRWQKALQKAARQNRPTEIIEVEMTCKDGSKKIINIFGTLVGKKTLGVFTDVTERKRVEEERSRLEDQMREVQKLESLGLLAGGIAHDFNNLLMAILGNADLGLLALSPASPARPNIEEIVLASQRAADLCRQMLAYSGKGRFEIGRYDLTEIVREMTQMLKVSVSKKAVLRYSFADNLPAVEVDATQMRQVIMNLITNASEALGDGNGVISVATGVMDCDRAYLAKSHLDDKLPEGRYVYLEVADTGCGMDEETRRRIFDPFFTTKFTGRGLGLAAVLGIVRGHRGAIKVTSEPGQGTTFSILLPAVAWEPGDRVLVATLTATPHRQGTILLVDDDPHVSRVAGEMLARLGLQVLTAAHGQEGLEILQERGEEIDCILLDLTMPGMGGEEAFLSMRRLRPDVPVVLSSGYDEQDATLHFKGQGLAGFIQKPYTVAKLQEVLNRVLGS